MKNNSERAATSILRMKNERHYQRINMHSEIERDHENPPQNPLRQNTQSPRIPQRYFLNKFYQQLYLEFQ